MKLTTHTMDKTSRVSIKYLKMFSISSVFIAFGGTSIDTRNGNSV